ncbi:NACHT domain-containing protein [Scytonema sp. UIC 10036]|uniref:NACHT domain-containing protein n=1 Tax=Scytonema sp. UIC 10036 TaxID=2304196 RepID=UPI00325A7FC4
MLADLYSQDMGTGDWVLGIGKSLHNSERANYDSYSPLADTQSLIPTTKTLRTKIPSNNQEYRNRQILLNKVKNYWVKGVLETSLHGVALIELGLENRFDALDRPWGMLWETPAQARQPLPKNTKIRDLFQQMGTGRSLLILGEPGSGKTTTLLELARDLLQEAELDINQPIPVVFNLSAWTKEKVTIADWLVQELNSKYQVSKEIGKTWIKNQQLLLLLDGLDEVLAEIRDICVEAINKFCQEYGETEIVVCSRIKDYEALSNRFRFQRSVFIQPLTLEQIQQYLQNAGSELAVVQTALQSDTTIQELAKSPLLLSIMTLAYQRMSMTDMPVMSLEERRQHLFDKYIQRMLERRMSRRLYSNEQVIYWLSWLAQRLKTQSQTVFFIERMQPSWLQKPWQRGIYMMNVLFVFILLGLQIAFLLIPSNRVVLAVIFTTVFFGLIFGFNRINPVETLKWSWKNASNSLILGMVWVFLFGLLLKLSSATLYISLDIQSIVNYYVENLPISGWIRGIVFSLCLGFIYVLIRGLTSPSIQTLSVPNQGIRQSAKNAIFFGLIGFFLLSLAAMTLHWRIWVWGIFGLLFGVAAGGGEACVKHLILRVILYFNGYIPWNYARFLDYATERIFLQKVGGGYIFIHRLLIEHFAQKNCSLMSGGSTFYKPQ